MIEINEIFSDSDKRIALWCAGVSDTNDLAIMAENIIVGGINLISVMPDIVQDIWVYLEKKPIKILARYWFDSNYKNIDVDITNLVANIANIFKHGADGVQIFLKYSKLADFVERILPVKEDLFFNKDVSICMDVSDVDINNWDELFRNLRNIGAKSFGLTLKEDMGNRSDFVGRIYGMLKNWDFDGELHFMLNNNYDRIDQVIRLIETEKPELNERIKFFLEY